MCSEARIHCFQALDTPGLVLERRCWSEDHRYSVIEMRAAMGRRNKSKRVVAAAALAMEVKVAGDEKIVHAFAFDDLTDKENPDFRYVF
jgi:hypothetical protein